MVVWLLRPVPVPASGEAIVMDRATTSSADTAVIASTEDTEATRRLAAEAVVRERYDAWILSWEARDLDRYMDFYSRDVEIKRAGKSPYDHAALRSRMGSHWSKLTYIRIDDGEPRLTHSGDRIELEVWHDYDSDTWWDKGTKRMTWLEEGGEWRIVGESFEKSSGGRK